MKFQVKRPMPIRTGDLAEVLVQASGGGGAIIEGRYHREQGHDVRGSINYQRTLVMLSHIASLIIPSQNVGDVGINQGMFMECLAHFHDFMHHTKEDLCHMYLCPLNFVLDDMDKTKKDDMMLALKKP
ncbi:hypothetical protein ACJX0J_034442, partial [Zea mays]